MVREISSGGVVIRKKDDEWWMAAIELPSAGLPTVAVPDATKREVRPKHKPVLCLPKGLVDPGEKPLEAALREVREETGITAVPITKLGDSNMFTSARGATASVSLKLSASIFSATSLDASTKSPKPCALKSAAQNGFASRTPLDSSPTAAKNKWRAKPWITSAPTQNCDCSFSL